MTKTGQFFSEFIASSVLMLTIFALKDDSNLGAGNLTPLMLFFLIFGIGATLGWETGYAINLARDFGPRLFTYFIGYGHEVWSAGNYYFWYDQPYHVHGHLLIRRRVPMIAPFFGCTFGGWLYDFLVYPGESPVNTPWVGLKRVVRPDWKAVKAELAGRDPEKPAA
jgi:aquaglyceroporin related protein